MEAEARLASARQAHKQVLAPERQQFNGSAVPLLQNGPQNVTDLCQSVEADLLLARAGLEQLCLAVKGRQIHVE